MDTHIPNRFVHYRCRNAYVVDLFHIWLHISVQFTPFMRWICILAADGRVSVRKYEDHVEFMFATYQSWYSID